MGCLSQKESGLAGWVRQGLVWVIIKGSHAGIWEELVSLRGVGRGGELHSVAGNTHGHQKLQIENPARLAGCLPFCETC